MKQALIFLASIFIYINCFGQNESDTDSIKAIRFGFFIEPTSGTGKLFGRVPLDHDPADVWLPPFTSSHYIDINSERNIGYSFGFEIRIIEAGNFLFKTGLSFEYFKYSASAGIKVTDDLTGDTTYYCTECHDFYYKDYFLHVPINVEYYINKTSASSIFFDVGASLSILLDENTSSSFEYAAYTPEFTNMFALVGIGVNLEAGVNTHLTIEPVFKYEVFQKRNVQYSAIGLKIALMFN
jgi:hypothetical protein